MSLTVNDMLAKMRAAYRAEKAKRRRNVCVIDDLHASEMTPEEQAKSVEWWTKTMRSRGQTPGECSGVYPGDLTAYIVSGVDAAKEQE